MGAHRADLAVPRRARAGCTVARGADSPAGDRAASRLPLKARDSRWDLERRKREERGEGVGTSEAGAPAGASRLRSRIAGTEIWPPPFSPLAADLPP